MGKNRRKEAWELFLKSLERKPLLAYLQQPAAPTSQPAPTSIPKQPQPAVPTSIVQPQQPQQQPQQQPAPTASQAQPASQSQAKPQQPAPAQPAQPAQPQPQPASRQAQFYQIKKTAEKLRGYGYSARIDACPRCGRPGTEKIYVRKNKRGGVRKYVYVFHQVTRDGKYDMCYIGPADNYIHVHRLHGDLSLTRLDETNYAEVLSHVAEKYIQQLQRALEEKKSSGRVYDIIYALRDLVELAKESCEALTEKYREECLRELKDVLSC